MAWILAVAVIASLLAGGGITYAADAAVPGDALYTLDRTIEEVRLELTGDPQAAFELQLALATERLEEAQVLLGKAEQARFGAALDDYGTSIDVVADTILSSGAADQTVLGGLLDEAIASHDTLLATMTMSQTQERAGEMVQTQDRDRLLWCGEISGTHEISNTLHPVGVMLAEKWVTVFPELTYDDIMGYFCQGYGFGEINLAFRISEFAGIDVEDVLAEHDDSEMGWGVLLQDYNLIGKDREEKGPFDTPPGLSGNGERPDPQGPQGATDEKGPQGVPGPNNETVDPGQGQGEVPVDPGSERPGKSGDAPVGPFDNRGNSSDDGNGRP